MWLRMWSSINSAIRLLMPPRTAERRWRIPAHDSSSLSARRTPSNWPMIFLLRFTRSSFSLEVCDILLTTLWGYGINGCGRNQACSSLRHCSEPPGFNYPVTHLIYSGKLVMRRSLSYSRFGSCVNVAMLFCLAVAPGLCAQESREQEQIPADTQSPETDPIPVMFPRPESNRWWISGQANFISQWHPAFHSPYQGRNSLPRQAQDATSRVLTLFTGLRLSSTNELICDVQESGGHGIGEALGLAGVTNLDVVRNTTLSRAPYVARLMVHQIIPLSREKETSERTPYSLFGELPQRHIEIRFGKMGIVDFFDVNNYGSDTNFQFMNWTVDNNGTYDYAADTRGFTFAAMMEYHDRHWAARFAEALMPKVANGIHLDADLSRAHSENMEFEIHRAVVRHQEGVLRLLAYVNHANMGSYRQAIDNFRAGLTPVPDITAHPLQTTIKYGFGANFEQPFNDWLGIFGRWGWNEGS